jgi:hypothetical protein
MDALHSKVSREGTEVNLSRQAVVQARSDLWPSSQENDDQYKKIRTVLAMA